MLYNIFMVQHITKVESLETQSKLFFLVQKNFKKRTVIIWILDWYVIQMVNLYSVFKWFQTQMPYLPFESRLMTIWKPYSVVRFLQVYLKSGPNEHK